MKRHNDVLTALIYAAKEEQVFLANKVNSYYI